ncbi:hypothetical protein Q5752_002059 [Cryptotrichosporon argae]
MLGLLSLLPFLAGAAALDDTAMRERSVYQLVTDRFALANGSTTSACSTSARQYCGGTWAAVSDKLDYIQGMGFDTVWISPVVDNIGGATGEGEAYHGYWSLDVSQLNANFGTADDLVALSSALHARGMYLMVDVVINHVAATSSSTFATSSSYGPFSVQDDFHPFCWISDYSNQTNVEYCWLGDDEVALPDLDTESATVVSYWNEWIAGLVANYTVDAIRIDTVKHVPQTFWPAFVAAAGVANVGEVLDGDASYVGPYQTNASINPFNYPIFYPLVRGFNETSGDLTAITSMAAEIKSEFSDPTLLGSFLNNHDNARFENYTSDSALIHNAHAYPFVTDGVPYLYYGSEDGLSGGNDPDNREALWLSGYSTTSTMYQYFRRLNAARSAAANASSTFYTTQMALSNPTSSTLLIAKPPLISVLTNAGSSASNQSVTIDASTSGWAAGTTVIDAVGCGTYTTDSSGNLALEVGSMPLVLINNSEKGTLCADYASTNSSSSSSTSAAGKVRAAGVAGVLATAALAAASFM